MVQDLLGIAVLTLLIVISAWDVKTRQIPNGLVLVLALVGLAILFLKATNLEAANLDITLLDILLYVLWPVIAASVVFLFLVLSSLMGEKIFGKPVFGMGDVKLISTLCLLVASSSIPSFLLITCLCMVVVGLIWLIGFKAQNFPCAPAISSAFVLFSMCFA